MRLRLVKQSMRELLPLATGMLIIGILAISISCYRISLNTAICYNIEIWIEGCNVIDFFLPLIAALPCTFSLYMKRKNNFLNYAAVRIPFKTYIRFHNMGGIVLSACMTFLIYFIGLVICIYLLEPQLRIENDYLINYPFGSTQINHPMMFGFIWCAWKAIAASFLTGFGYRIALYVDNLFLIIMAPFFYCMAENLITGMLKIPQYSIMTSYILNRLTPSAMHIWNYGIGLLSFFCITCLIVWMIRKKKEFAYEKNRTN